MRYNPKFPLLLDRHFTQPDAYTIEGLDIPKHIPMNNGVLSLLSFNVMVLINHLRRLIGINAEQYRIQSLPTRKEMMLSLVNGVFAVDDARSSLGCGICFEGGHTRHQDAHEALSFLFRTLGDKQNPVLNAMFMFEHVTRVICNSCAGCVSTFGQVVSQFFFPVSFSNPIFMAQRASSNTVQLSDLLNECCRGDYDGRAHSGCQHCEDTRLGLSTAYDFIALPPYLLINVLRFDNESRKVVNKLHVDDSIIFHDVHGVDVQYDRVYQIHHYGNTLDAGHYYAFSKCSEGWLRISDDSIRDVDSNIMDEPSDEVTIVMYKRRDGDDVSLGAAGHFTLKDSKEHLQNSSKFIMYA